MYLILSHSSAVNFGTKLPRIVGVERHEPFPKPWDSRQSALPGAVCDRRRADIIFARSREQHGTDGNARSIQFNKGGGLGRRGPNVGDCLRLRGEINGLSKFI